MIRREPIFKPDAILKPPLKWAGGKRWLAPFISDVWKYHSAARLVEPFCGGLSVALNLRPVKALLNDANVHLINFYDWVKRGLTIAIDARNEQEVYYANRDQFNELIGRGKERSKEAAQLFYYLNRTCFNGLCRFNQSGSFNVPFGSYSYDLNYSPDFEAYQHAFEGWVFTDRDFEGIELKADDFIYADPPYDVEFTAYSKGGFTWADQERTAKWLAAHSGPVILSNQKTDKIIKLYTELDFELMFRNAPRRISCNGDRRDAKEVLAFRNVDLTLFAKPGNL